MLTLSAELLDVLIAVKTEIGPHGVATGIVKETIPDPVLLTKSGLVGDFQVDRRVHGGEEKAVYHFPYENYTLLKQAFTHLSDQISSPCTGENFSTLGLTENSVHIGDTFKIGGALIQVSQPRMPCWKLNHKLGNAYIGRFVITEAITGWYYRVLQEGRLQIGQHLTLIDRMPGSIPVKDVWIHWINNKKNQIQSTSPTPEIPGLSQEWEF